MLCGRPFVTNENRFYKTITQTRDFNNEADEEQLKVLPSETPTFFLYFIAIVVAAMKFEFNETDWLYFDYNIIIYLLPNRS